MSVQLPKPGYTSGTFVNSNEKFLFSVHEIFTTWCALFLIEIEIEIIEITHFKVLSVPSVYGLCSLLSRSQGV